MASIGRCFTSSSRPADDLQQLIGYHLEKLGGKGNYISCTFRFRQLLGDFKEGGATLPVAKRQPYIQQCVQTVERLHKMHPEKRILVTADSHTFLDELTTASLPYVYVMPGKVVHLGFTSDASKAVYMKSFLDMYMLSCSGIVYPGYRQVADAKHISTAGGPVRWCAL